MSMGNELAIEENTHTHTHIYFIQKKLRIKNHGMN
jgi:hypothetical protein